MDSDSSVVTAVVDAVVVLGGDFVDVAATIPAACPCSKQRVRMVVAVANAAVTVVAAVVTITGDAFVTVLLLSMFCCSCCCCFFFCY